MNRFSRFRDLTHIPAVAVSAGSLTFMCMGCGVPKPTTGCRGTGALKRCADCVANPPKRKEK